MQPSRPFPSDFLWGASTAAYQIEGAAREDGRGESIWDRFSRTSGNVRNEENGDIACDFYHRYPQDIRLIRDLGLDTFRFSISWPRVLPHGRGSVNEKGLDFYDRLTDALLASNIRPFVTLYHWDLPQALEEAGQSRGGWLNRETVDAFAEFTEVVVRRLGDRVHDWITLNEPWVSAWMGYGWGSHAPGKTGERHALTAAHHLLLAHGRAVDVIRRGAAGAKVGITLNLTPAYPGTESPEDRSAAALADGQVNRWFLDPIFRGSYPEDMLRTYEGKEPPIEDGDLETISVPIDFLGINNYSRQVVQAGAAGNPAVPIRPEGSTYTDMDWEVYPSSLHDLLLRVHREYAPPCIYITENGAAFPDVRVHDGSVPDPERCGYLDRYIQAVGRAIADGVPVGGYFVWSLLDNFEWSFGYWKRFGIVYVDFPTLERVPKSSYYWYRDFIRRHQRVEERAGEAALPRKH
jgi:beta-glucosidase